MPIDFSPIANMQPVNLAQIYGQADQANNQRMQNNLLNMKMQQAQKEQADNEAIKGAYAGAISPDGTLDRKTLFANLYKVDPNKALEAQTTFNNQDIASSKSKREDTNSQLDQAKKISDLMGGSAKNVLANPTLQNALFETQKFGKLTGADVSQELANLQQIGDNPDGLRKWAAGHALTAEQLLPKIQMQDTGGTSNVLSIDPLTGKPSLISSTNKTATPDAIMSNERAISEGKLNRGVQIRGQNLTDARAKENVNGSKAPSGYLWSSDGSLIPIKGGPADPQTKLKQVPATISTAIVGNKQTLSKLDSAIALLEGKDVGTGKNKMIGDASATGWKGLIPPIALNRMDPKGTDARAQVADIGSLILHDRSGAAVTASESPRLMPFIPSATDDNVTALKKLRRLRDMASLENDVLSSQYSEETGYKSSKPSMQASPTTPKQVFHYDAQGNLVK